MKGSRDTATFGNAKEKRNFAGWENTACLLGKETVKVNKILSLQKYLNNGWFQFSCWTFHELGVLTAQGVPALQSQSIKLERLCICCLSFWIRAAQFEIRKCQNSGLGLDLQPLKPSTISCIPPPPSPAPFLAHTPLLLTTAPKNAAHTFLAPKENIREWVYFLQIALCSKISQAQNKESIMSNWNSSFWGFQYFSEFKVKWILMTNRHFLDCQLCHCFSLGESGEDRAYW